MTLPARGTSLYLDWNATTPPHPDVVEAMRLAALETWGNPSSVHAVGRAARAVVEDARHAVAALADADPRDVILTSGATEANNLALRSAPALVTSRIEHPSVVRVAEALEQEGRLVRWLPVPPSGCVEPADVAAAISGLPPGFVVALMAANHETGVLQQVREVAGLVQGASGRLHVDAAQAAGKVGRELWAAGATISLAGHKLRGPKGIGALIVRVGPPPRPVLLGGAQERGLRPGTLDPVAAAGLAVALRRAAADGPLRYARVAALRERLESALAAAASVNGNSAPRLPHVTNLSVHGWRGDELVAALDLEGVCVSSGSACSAGTAEPSPTLSAMVGRERALSAVRLSLGDETTAEDVEAAIRKLIRVVGRGSSTA